MVLTWFLRPVLAAIMGAACAAPAVPADDCRVARVADGDTFYCRDGRKVRLIGIDTPELAQRPAGDRARSALGRLLPAHALVRLELDAAPRDRYGRTLAYAWRGDRLVNEAMVREGWAMLYTVPPNVRYAGRLARAQNEARARRAGLWKEGVFECPPSEFRRRRCVSAP